MQVPRSGTSGTDGPRDWDSRPCASDGSGGVLALVRIDETRWLPMSHAVVHFEIGAQDAAKVREFYRSLFGWQFDTTDPSYGVIADTDGGIGGGVMQIRENMTPYVTIYVAVDDLSEMLSRVEELGGARVVGPRPIPGVGEFAMFTDPEDHLIGLISTGRASSDSE